MSKALSSMFFFFLLSLAQARLDLNCSEVECFVDPCASMSCTGSCVSDCNCNAICECTEKEGCGMEGACRQIPSTMLQRDVGVCVGLEGDSCGGFRPNPFDCAPGLSCVYSFPRVPDLPGTCTRVAACRMDSDCGPENFCSMEGHCTTFGGCDSIRDCFSTSNQFASIDCVGTMLCYDHQCEKQCGDTSCSTNAECGSGLICSTEGNCVEPPFPTQCSANLCPEVQTAMVRMCEDGSTAFTICAAANSELSSSLTDSANQCQWMHQCPNDRVLCGDGSISGQCDPLYGVSIIHPVETPEPEYPDEPEYPEEPNEIPMPEFVEEDTSTTAAVKRDLTISLAIVLPMLAVLAMAIALRYYLHRRSTVGSSYRIEESTSQENSYDPPSVNSEIHVEGQATSEVQSV